VYVVGSNLMWGATRYREKALELLDSAQQADDRRHKARLLELAQAYARLADLADKNSTTDIVYETPLRRHGAAVAGSQPPQHFATPPRVGGDPAA
jgi:hypothetical protein